MVPLISNSFCVYGLGVTGQSVISYFKKKNFTNYYAWDDNKILRNFSGIRAYKKIDKKFFSKKLDSVDFIVMSPGISLKKTKFKKKLLKHKNKIITDLDLFYLFNPKIKSIVVTGTNGKSTTCKILEHILKKK